MITVKAQGVYIEIDKSGWLMFKDVPMSQRGLISHPLLQVSAGTDVMLYQPEYGGQVGLPGDRISAQYIRAVLIGFHDKSRQWLLGIHLAKSEDEKPIFKPLIRWMAGDSVEIANDVRNAARPLALMLGVPLKVFGEKKLPATTDDPARSGVTGPLEPHLRERIESKLVKQRAQEISLPVKAEHFTLSKSGNGLAIKIGNPVGGDVPNPVYNQAEINIKQRKVKLVPPTGLLGAFMGVRGQEYSFNNIRNIEYRYVQQDIVEDVPSEDGKFTVERMTKRHIWGLYLTLEDESLLLLQTAFTQSAELMQSRVSTVSGGNKLSTNSAEGFRYFKEHLREQEQIDEHQKVVERCAYLIAEAIGCHVVVTEVTLEL